VSVGSDENEPVRVLIAEDDASYARLLRAMLHGAAGARFEVRNVDRLADAIGLIEGGWANVLLLDLSLPDSRGLATVQAARHAAPALAIVVLTGSHDVTLAAEVFREGIEDYVLKDDVTPSLLLRCVRYALERKALRASAHAAELDLAALQAASAGLVFRLSRAGGVTLIDAQGAPSHQETRIRDLVPTPLAEALLAAVEAVIGGAQPTSVSGTMRSSDAIVPCTAVVTRRSPLDALVILKSAAT
jgi:DNA-binding NarL/FixJ family response regulator